MSELRTNKIYPRDGLPAGATAGGVVQMVQGEVTSFLQTSSSSYVDTGLSATITPTSSSNKILVNIALGVYGGATDTLRVNAQVLRGSTQVWYNRDLYFRSGSAFKAVQNAIQFIDSPATTSSTTYKLQVKCESTSSGSTFELYADSTNYNNRMILMEVSG
tara:strand:- start:67 stop:549 length:483 start_codon:yes stop_codon:yes gene_type:complete